MGHLLRRGPRLQPEAAPFSSSMSQGLPERHCAWSDRHRHSEGSGPPSGSTEAFPGASGGLWERSWPCLPELRQQPLVLPKPLFQEGSGGAEARPCGVKLPGSGTCCALAAPATPGASPNISGLLS